jgi:hypothetical protein
MLHRILFGKQSRVRQKRACRRVGTFDVLESRAMLSGDPPPWMAPTDEGLSDATITPVEGPPTELTQEEIDACSGNWQSITIRVYVTDYFSGDVNGTLQDVAEFYQEYCILITWEIVHIHTPDHINYVLPYSDNSPTYQIITNPNEQYLGELDLGTPDGEVPDLANEPELNWYWEHFDHVPSVFLIDDIDLPGLMPGPDAFGLTYGPFIFIPDSAAPWTPDYDCTLAQEIGHVLGLPEGTSEVSVMGEVAPGDLEDSFFTGDELEIIQVSPRLTPIPDPEPTPSPGNP